MIQALIAAAIAAAVAGGAAAAVKEGKENEIRGNWDDLMKDYESVKKFDPGTIFSNEYEVNPNTYQLPDDLKYTLASADPESKNKLMSAILGTRDMADSSIQSKTDLDRAKTMMDASQESSAREQGIINSLGAGNAGLAASLRASGAQALAQRQMLGGLASNAASGQERLGAQKAYTDAFRGLYDSDLNQNNRNADVANQFDMMNSERKRQINERNIDLLNKAKYINTDSRRGQDVAQRAIERQQYQDKLDRLKDKERITGYKSGSIRNSGEIIGGAIQQAGQIVGSTASGIAGAGTGSAANIGSAGGGQSSDQLYQGYLDYMKKQGQ